MKTGDPRTSSQQRFAEKVLPGYRFIKTEPFRDDRGSGTYYHYDDAASRKATIITRADSEEIAVLTEAHSLH